MSSKQTELFNEIIDLKYKIEYVASFVQNDFESLLENGYIKKDEIPQQMDKADKAFHSLILSINSLRNRTREVMYNATILPTKK